ncbi:MAG: NAD(P)(+) transhydrogenase (Re/Si-specific) subunit beta [Planctomycetota bacterium]|nr:MAG: NAD(P)(+) transhydrogenase (Re/Si-specific) subunit beta [Planctomycetota bacterium]
MHVLADIAYLAAAALFVLGLKMLNRVRTARRGNALAAVGMALAIIATLATHAGLSWSWIIAGLLAGSVLGAWLARAVPMTSMPEMVALLNGLGGLASLLVGLSVFWSEYLHPPFAGGAAPEFPLAQSHAGGAQWALTVVLSVIVGAVTFTGSLMAVLKLQEKLVKGTPIVLPGRHAINVGVALATLALGAFAGFVLAGPAAGTALLALAVLAGVLGVLLVIPIGGADMPVVISLLNSYSGIAGSMTGFVLNEPLLIAAGALVGASGIILSQLMCKAMNRSLGAVLIGGFGAGGGDKSAYKNVKSASPEEAAMILDGAGSVIFVPGYGMAVSQAQHVVKDLANALESRGTNVRFAIHPVAGRMPGHMNVLLAEADVPYDKLYELDRINGDFKTTEVAVVIGANDVVNPAAIDDPQSPIAGMPILNVHEAQTVLMVKRSLSPGYAGIKNPLFERDNCLMCFGDGKQFLSEVLQELKS